jgi:hypothetical protein
VASIAPQSPESKIVEGDKTEPPPQGVIHAGPDATPLIPKAEQQRDKRAERQKAVDAAIVNLTTTPLPGMRAAVQAVLCKSKHAGVALELSTAVEEWRATV